MTAVLVALTGGFAAIVSTSGLLGVLLEKAEVVPPPLPQTAQAYITVRWSENEGRNSSATSTSVLTLAGTFGPSQLVFLATADQLGFPAIESSAEGWPPNLAGWRDNGLQDYSISATIDLPDERKVEVNSRAMKLGAIGVGGPYYLLLPIPSGKFEFSEAPERPVNWYPISAAGIVELAKAETGR